MNIKIPTETIRYKPDVLKKLKGKYFQVQSESIKINLKDFLKLPILITGYFNHLKKLNFK